MVKKRKKEKKGQESRIMESRVVKGHPLTPPLKLQAASWFLINSVSKTTSEFITEHKSSS